jgi:chloramphenicol O-acetyltransferase type A
MRVPSDEGAACRVLREYPRRAHLEFFRRNPNPFYSVTFELEATRVLARARALAASTYAALVWSYHRALLRIDAFRTRLQGEDVVLYDSLRVGMTVPAPDRTFSFAPLAWEEDAQAFLARAAATMARASAQIDLAGGAAPDFAYYTALPRVPFSSFTHVALADPTAGQPEAAFGRFEARSGRTFVPVGVLVNHLYVDGADLGDLYEAAQESFTTAF